MSDKCIVVKTEIPGLELHLTEPENHASDFAIVFEDEELFGYDLNVYANNDAADELWKVFQKKGDSRQ